MGLPKSNTSLKRVKFSLKEENNEDTVSQKTKLKLAKGEGPSNKVEQGERADKPNRLFYRVSNHQELFKIGQSFYEDCLSGIKSFAISSTGYQTSQQKTILGLASFFDHKEDNFKIAIVSDNLDQGAFSDIVLMSKTIPSIISDKNHSLDIKSFYNHFDFIDLNKVLKLSQNDELGEFECVFDYIIDSYDIVFWDVPELHKIQIYSEIYFPMIMKFESLSIIVAKKISKQSEVDELKQFFLGYGINMKGLLFDNRDHSSHGSRKADKQPISNKDKIIEKKHWWQRLFK